MIGGPPRPPLPPRPRGTAVPAGTAAGSALERFTHWLTGLGDALEAADAESLKPLFTVETTYAPDPFAPLDNGRRAVIERLSGEVAGSTGLSFEARVLGAGETYGVAHIRLVSAERTVDGVLLVAMDARGRCTALRRWAHVGESAADPAKGVRP
ncbi:MAG: hypothetical protein H0W00_04410 [Chloroflexi bacterium]|nr:hypothetical protein [Chloroflexota bacterium]